MDRREPTDRRMMADRRVTERRDEDKRNIVCKLLTDRYTIAVILAVCAGVILGSLLLIIVPLCS